MFVILAYKGTAQRGPFMGENDGNVRHSRLSRDAPSGPFIGENDENQIGAFSLKSHTEIHRFGTGGRVDDLPVQG